MAWKAPEVGRALCVLGRAAAMLARTLGLRHVSHQVTWPCWPADCREELDLILRTVGDQWSILEKICCAFHFQTGIYRVTPENKAVYPEQSGAQSFTWSPYHSRSWASNSVLNQRGLPAALMASSHSVLFSHL